MRISTTGSNLTDGQVSIPVDPPQPIPLNEIFELEFLRVSANDVPPFQEVEFEWSIRLLDDRFAFVDFIFTLSAAGEDVATDIGANGRVLYSPYQSVVLRITGGGRGSGDISLLGHPLALRVDHSRCLALPLASQRIDEEVRDRLAERIGHQAVRLRLREGRQVESSWELGVIRYYFPMQVTMDNFFDAYLDVRLAIRFSVHHLGEDTDLDVTVTHSSNVDFDNILGFLTGFRTDIIAQTCNRLIPLILDYEVREIERNLIREVLKYVPDTRRLVAVYVHPLDTTEPAGEMVIVSCLIPEEPDGSGPVVDPTAPE